LSNIDPFIKKEIFVTVNLPDDKKSLSVAGQYSSVQVIRNPIQKGFSENHNNVIRRNYSQYVLILNPDVIIRKGFVEKLIEVIDSDKSIGVVAGKLLHEDQKTIDSAGHNIYRNRRTYDRGQNELDNGQYDRSEEVFSACGAAMLCRREMLDDIKIDGEYFDESFFLYKEDLDLCWRARLRGWKVYYEPTAIAYHLRGWGADKKRSHVPAFIRRHSYKNRYLLMIKNDHFINILKDLPFILLHEIKALIYVLFREPHLLIAWIQIIFLLPFTIKKRVAIMKNARTSANEIRKWFA
jgi:GT2 family glycosyltransferase